MKPTDWGGDGISRFKGIRINCKNIGESWELSAVPGCESIVMDGVDCGMTLADMVAKYKERLMGDSVYSRFGNQFPLALKFSDNQNNLTIQMHSCVKGPGNDGSVNLPVVMTEDVSKVASGEFDFTDKMSNCEDFQVKREIIDGECTLTNNFDSFMGVVCIEGTGNIKVDGVSTSVRQGESLLLPARTDKFDVEGTLAILTIVIPTLIVASDKT